MPNTKYECIPAFHWELCEGWLELLMFGSCCFWRKCCHLGSVITLPWSFIRTYYHQVARNMMMFYLLSGGNDVTCSHLWCMRMSLKTTKHSKSLVLSTYQWLMYCWCMLLIYGGKNPEPDNIVGDPCLYSQLSPHHPFLLCLIWGFPWTWRYCYVPPNGWWNCSDSTEFYYQTAAGLSHLMTDDGSSRHPPS